MGKPWMSNPRTSGHTQHNSMCCVAYYHVCKFYTLLQTHTHTQ